MLAPGTSRTGVVWEDWTMWTCDPAGVLQIRTFTPSEMVSLLLFNLLCVSKRLVTGAVFIEA